MTIFGLNIWEAAIWLWLAPKLVSYLIFWAIKKGHIGSEALYRFVNKERIGRRPKPWWFKVISWLPLVPLVAIFLSVVMLIVDAILCYVGGCDWDKYIEDEDDLPQDDDQTDAAR